MKAFIKIDSQGKVLFYSGLVGDVTGVPGYSAATHKTVQQLPDDINLVYWDGGLKRMPLRPSEHHRFNYGTKTWELDAERAQAATRFKRDNLLSNTDWVLLRAMDRGEPVPPEWLAYRQALRDVTEQDGFPLDVAWPEKPAS